MPVCRMGGGESPADFPDRKATPDMHVIGDVVGVIQTYEIAINDLPKSRGREDCKEKANQKCAFIC